MKKLFLLPLLILSISSCNLLPNPTTTINTGVDTLNEVIRKIENNSDSWQVLLKETRDKLIQEGQSTLSNEVSNILSRATSDVGIEAKCYTDFLRDRTKEDLIKLRATLTGEKLKLIPVFCNPTPSSIDMNLSPERRPMIEIAGYNLTRDSVRVFLVDSQNQRSDVSNSLDNPTPYLLTIILDRVSLADNSERLVFEFSNGEERSIGIIKAYKPPKEEFRLSRIHVTGSIYMNDDELGFSDENKTVTVDSYVNVLSNVNTPFHWEDCVGDEVQGYLDAQMQLNKETGSVSIQVSARYYEGTECDETNLKDTRSRDIKIEPNQSNVFLEKLSDNDGSISFNLNFKNEYVEKVQISHQRTLINAGGKCLDVHAPDMGNNGGKVQVWDCNGERQQQWSFQGNTLVNAGGKCLDVHAPDMGNNGGKVQVWDCNGERQQQWSFQGNTLVNAGGKCLDVHAPDMGNNGGKVQVWDCNGERQQQWSF